MGDLPIMLSIVDAAAAVKMPKHFIRQAALTGKVVSVRAGSGSRGKIFINLESLRSYLQTGKGDNGDL